METAVASIGGGPLQDATSDVTVERVRLRRCIELLPFAMPDSETHARNRVLLGARSRRRRGGVPTARLQPSIGRCRLVVAAARTLVAFALLGEAHAQWVPRGALAAVPIVHGCDETGGDVAVSRLDPPAVYVCDRVVRLIRTKDPGAERFYLVHEFGHVALQTSSESAADCWAARELVAVPNGSRTLRIAIAHFRSRGGEPSARYGSPRQRAERIQSCADEALPGWDAPAAPPRRAASAARTRPHVTAATPD